MSSIGKMFLPILCLLFFLLSPGNVYSASDDLLQNSQFNNFDGTNFPPWLKNVSTLTLEATSSAAVLKSSSTSTKYIYQIVPATASASYRLTSRANQIMGSSAAYLRITQCSTATCASTKEEIKSTDSVHSDNPTDQELSLDITTATNAMALKIKLNLDPKDSSPSALSWSQPLLELLAADSATSSSLISSSGATDAGTLTLSFTLPATVSAGSEFTVPLSLFHAKANTTYLLKGLGGVATSSSDWRSIYTKDPITGDFLAWNGSWSKMPTLLTDSEGVATSSLTVKFNPETTILGTNNFLVRIREEGSENNIDSLFQSLTVEQAIEVASNPSVEKIEWSLPATAVIGEDFKLKTKLSGFKPNTKYLVKVRGSKDGSSWSAAATANNNSWYSDTASWSKFPEIETNDEGIWEGELGAQIKESYEAGSYLIYLRVRDPGEEENTDSETQTLSLQAPSLDQEEVNGATISAGVLGEAQSAYATLEEQPPFPILIASWQEQVLGQEELVLSTVSESEGVNLVAGGLALLGLSILSSLGLPRARKPDPVSKQSSLLARQLLPIGKLH